jgi:hypothetical protein
VVASPDRGVLRSVLRHASAAGCDRAVDLVRVARKMLGAGVRLSVRGLPDGKAVVMATNEQEDGGAAQPRQGARGTERTGA